MACCRSPGPPCKCWCGGVLLSHTLPGAVPSPCRALASRFGMGLGVSPGPWPPQDLFLLCPRRRGRGVVPVVRGPDRDASGLLPRLVLRSPVTRGDCRRQGLQEGASPSLGKVVHAFDR